MSSSRRSPALPLLFEALDELAYPASAEAFAPCVSVEHETQVSALVEALATQCAEEGVTYPLAQMEAVSRRVVARSTSVSVQEDEVQPKLPTVGRCSIWRQKTFELLPIAVFTAPALAIFAWAPMPLVLKCGLLLGLTSAGIFMREELRAKSLPPVEKEPAPIRPALATVTLTAVSSPTITIWSQAYTTITVTPPRLSQYLSHGITQGVGPTNYMI